MNKQPLINSLSFTYAFYQINCSIQEQTLKISVSSLQGQTLKSNLALFKMAYSDKTLNLWISGLVVTNNALREQQSSRDPHSMEWQQMKDKLIVKKMSELELTVQKLEYQLQQLHNENINLSTMLQQKYQNYSKSNQIPQLIKISGQARQQKKVIKQTHEVAKLEMLNSVLQQKLFEKEGDIVSLDKKVFQRDQLIRELADKLMVANVQKDDIFNEYQKILQTTVFNSQEGIKQGKLLLSRQAQTSLVSPVSIKRKSEKIYKTEEGMSREEDQKEIQVVVQPPVSSQE